MQAETRHRVCRNVIVGFFVGSICLGLFAGCDIPRDPNDTLERVRNGTMRVGVVEARPWVVLGEAPTGVEVALLEGFARTLDADIVWIKGTVPDLIEALAHFELEVVVAGLTEVSPGLSEVGHTNAFLTADVLVGVPPDEPAPGEIEGLPVAAEQGSIILAWLEERRGARSGG